MNRIPVTVITGFLGAGKTTLIHRLLEQADGRRIALVINEFGEMGVDRALLVAAGQNACREEDIVELANGCICCTVADDFIPTMEMLLARTERPDHIIIETSGLALPQPLIRAFNWPEIRAQVTLDGVVTVVDAAALSEGRFAADEDVVARRQEDAALVDHATPLGELFADQLVAADLLVVSKADLVSEADLSQVEAKLRSEMRPGTGMIRSAEGRVDMKALLGLGVAGEDHLEGRASAHERLHGVAEHDHDEFDSFSIRLPAMPREELLGRIEDAIRAHDVLRLKGFAALPGADARLAIQAVGPRITAWFDRAYRPDEPRETALVVIGESPLDRAAIAAQLSAMVI